MLGPILAREWLILPRRSRHYLTRATYLGALWVLVLTLWQTTIGWERAATLGDLARFGQIAFQFLAYVQLLLVLFFAALAAASAVSLEKDRRTFLLLLVTDLRGHEIVLGKLFGSMLQIGVLVLGSVPLLALLVLLGGIAPGQVAQTLVILASASLAAGSLGSLMGLWRERTFQSLALTVLLLVLYLCLVQGLSLLTPWVDAEGQWIPRLQTYLQPFLAQSEVLDPPLGVNAPAVPAAYGFGLAMLALTVLLNVLAVWKLRVWNPNAEPILQREAPDDVQSIQEEKARARAHAAPGPVRAVWANPILWREIATRAYGRRPLLVKVAYFLVLALVVYAVLGSGQRTEWAAARGLAPLCILSLVLISAQAVTSITSERDLGALDLLLVTDLSPREFVFGKIWGILYNAKEYLLPPFLLLGVYAALGYLATPPPGRSAVWANVEAFVFLAVGLLILFAFTVVLGVHVGLRTANSRLAAINTLGTVFFLSIGTLVCIYLILINGRFEYQWLSFIAFLATGIAGLWWVLSANEPSSALTAASFLCPPAVFYSVTNVLIGRPGMAGSSDPLIPFIVTGGAFSFAIAAMLVPMLAEFDVAVGRTSAGGE